VLILMAINAAYRPVVGARSRQLTGLLLVADLAERRGQMADRLHLQGAVGRMTLRAVSIRLRRQVGRMTGQTAGNKFVSVMAAGAEQLRMAAGRCRHLLPHLGMAGKTLRAQRFHRISQRGQRLMRIGMAIQAVLDLKMGLPLMAKGAGNYCIFSFRQMLRMAVKATRLCGMFPPFLGKSLLLEPMTLAAILLLQLRLRLGRSQGAGTGQQKQNYQPAAGYQAYMMSLFQARKNRFHKVLRGETNWPSYLQGSRRGLKKPSQPGISCDKMTSRALQPLLTTGIAAQKILFCLFCLQHSTILPCTLQAISMPATST
jgi:hypothetical protein